MSIILHMCTFAFTKHCYSFKTPKHNCSYIMFHLHLIPIQFIVFCVYIYIMWNLDIEIPHSVIHLWVPKFCSTHNIFGLLSLALLLYYSLQYMLLLCMVTCSCTSIIRICKHQYMYMYGILYIQYMYVCCQHGMHLIHFNKTKPYNFRLNTLYLYVHIHAYTTTPAGLNIEVLHYICTT